jgi:hypothetical protein
MEKTLEMTKKYCRSRLVAADGGQSLTAAMADGGRQEGLLLGRFGPKTG